MTEAWIQNQAGINPHILQSSVQLVGIWREHALVV
jgi:hypothetical protein